MSDLNLRKRTRDDLVSSIENAMSSFILRNTRNKNKQELDVDQNLLKSIKTINTMSKYLNAKRRSLLDINEIEAKRLYHEISKLYDLKEKTLRKIVTKHNIKPIGYHTKKNSSQPIPLYVINEFQFHCILNKYNNQELDIPFLGVFNSNLKRDFDSTCSGELDDLQEALDILSEY